LQAESGGQAAEAPILEEGSDGVRLMTVHKAKGLEFPVVILGDMTARLTPFDANRSIDAAHGLCALRIGGWAPKELNDARDLELRRERREGERIAYVAATRARDLLVVPAVGDEPYPDGWVAPLNRAIYPAETARRTQAAAAGCPSFASRDSVLERPEGDPAKPHTVCPGGHEIVTDHGAHAVVWWSPEPGALELDAQAPFGLRRDDLIVKDVAPTVLRRQLDTYTAWRQNRDAVLATAAEPSVRLLTATQAALAALPDGLELPPVAHVHVDGRDERPGGTRFGSLVHALLADVPLDDPSVLSRLAVAHGRLLGAPGSEVRAAERLVRAALSHDVLRGAAVAAVAGRCARETPVTLTLPDGAVVEGIVDLAYETDDCVVVVDFKTDVPDGPLLDRYRRQIGLYAAAVTRASDRPVTAILMTV
jgi:ATP-dependent exoDNAse (exonuclease V) beta subunit